MAQYKIRDDQDEDEKEDSTNPAEQGGFGHIAASKRKKGGIMPDETWNKNNSYGQALLGALNNSKKK